MKRKFLGFFLILATILMLWAIYENIAPIQNAIPSEIALLIAFFLPVPLVILELILIVLIGYPNILESREGTEFAVGLTYAVAFCATAALMANLFLSLPESFFASISKLSQMIILIICLLVFAGLILVFQKPKNVKPSGDALVSRILTGFIIVLFFILSILIGINSPDIMTSIKGTVLLFLVFPPIVPFFLMAAMVLNYLMVDKISGMAMSGIEMFAIYLLYPIFVAAGTILGAAIYLIASLF